MHTKERHLHRLFFGCARLAQRGNFRDERRFRWPGHKKNGPGASGDKLDARAGLGGARVAQETKTCLSYSRAQGKAGHLRILSGAAASWDARDDVRQAWASCKAMGQEQPLELPMRQRRGVLHSDRRSQPSRARCWAVRAYRDRVRPLRAGAFAFRRGDRRLMGRSRLSRNVSRGSFHVVPSLETASEDQEEIVSSSQSGNSIKSFMDPFFNEATGKRK